MIGNQLTPAFTLLAIVTLAAGKPPPPPDAPWAKFVSKPVYARSLGPPPMSGMGTISVPYIPKPTMFPKLVDPRMMIAKKTDLLSNIFGGLGPVMGPSYGSFSPYGGYGSPAYQYPYSGAMYGAEENVGPDPASDDAENSPVSYGPGFNPKAKFFETAADDSLGTSKRGLFGPMGPKSSFGGPFASKTPMGSPFYEGSAFPDSSASGSSPFFKRGITGPTGTFMNPFSAATDPSIFKIKSKSSTDGNDGTPTTQGSLSSHSITPVTPEETNKSVDKEAKESPLDNLFGTSTSKVSKRMIAGTDSVPKQYLPGMYGPMGPFYGPPGFGFGPEAFVGKKSMFLDTLFKNLATSTTTPPSATDTPVTDKSTIVPPGFWLPETVVPDPESYNAKVGTFLEKLFDSLKLNASTTANSPLQSVTYEESISAGFPGGKTDATRSLPMDFSGTGTSPYFNKPGSKTVRSLADPEAVIIAKDQIVNSIIGELGVLKDDMMSTFNELIAYQKNSSTSATGSKPFKPYAPPFWSAMSSAAAVDVGTLPYKQRMIILNQVFDMLTDLHTNVSSAVNEAVKSSYDEDIPPVTTTVMPDIMTLNISVLDDILAKLNALNSIALTKVPAKGFSSKFTRALPTSPTSFWVAYPGDKSAKRNLIENQEIPRIGDINFAKENEKDFPGMFTPGKDSRAIRMQMHQGYQSLPPGTIESVQAGGGSVPGHEGGGVKLLIKMPAYDTTSRDGNEDYKDYRKWQDWSKAMEDEYKKNHHHHHDRH